MNHWNTVKISPRPSSRFSALASLVRCEIAEHHTVIVKTPLIMGAVGLFLIALTLLGIAGSHQFVEFSQSVKALQGPKLAAAVFSEIRSHYAYMGTLLAIVMSAVSFMYCVHALFDERRTRSVLFWKSLPISDAQIVGSKALTALVVIPAVYTSVFVALAYTTIIGYTLIAGLMGWNIAPIVLSKGLLGPASMLAMLPVYAVWALPAVGYLMFISATSKSVPFLRALCIPFVLIVALAFVDVFPIIDVPFFAYDAVARWLYSVVPFSWNNLNANHPLSAWNALLTAEAWVGAVFGLGFLYAAGKARQKQDDQTL